MKIFQNRRQKELFCHFGFSTGDIFQMKVLDYVQFIIQQSEKCMKLV